MASLVLLPTKLLNKTKYIWCLRPAKCQYATLQSDAVGRVGGLSRPRVAESPELRRRLQMHDRLRAAKTRPPSLSVGFLPSPLDLCTFLCTDPAHSPTSDATPIARHPPLRRTLRGAADGFANNFSNIWEHLGLRGIHFNKCFGGAEVNKACANKYFLLLGMLFLPPAAGKGPNRACRPLWEKKPHPTSGREGGAGSLQRGCRGRWSERNAYTVLCLK